MALYWQIILANRLIGGTGFKSINVYNIFHFILKILKKIILKVLQTIFIFH